MSSQALIKHEMQMYVYVGIVTLITLHIHSTLLAQKWSLGVSEISLHAELKL